MKKTLTLIALVFSVLISYSQEVQLTFGIDLRNATFGSNPTNNKPSLDAIYGLKVVDNHHFEYGISRESFHEIGYQSWKLSFGKQFQLTDWLIGYANVEPTQIIRTRYAIIYPMYYDENNVIQMDLNKPIKIKDGLDGYVSTGSNLGLNFRLNDILSIGLQTNILWRRDLDKMYSGTNIKPSGYINLIFDIHYGENR